MRSAGNQRRYPRDVLRRIAFIRVAQRVGISLADIAAALAALPTGRTPHRADWARLSIDRCRLRNPMDAISVHGPGARRRLVV